MTQNTKTISPLRQRMTEDMVLRKLSPKTQAAYIRAVKNFTRFIRRSPDTASAEDLRQFHLYPKQTITKLGLYVASMSYGRYLVLV